MVKGGTHILSVIMIPGNEVVIAQRMKSCCRALRTMSESVCRKRTNASAPVSDWLSPHSR